jgi:hypothetical protein
MQFLLWGLAFLPGSLLCGVLLLLVCPCQYFIEGNKQENLWGFLAVQVGFLKLRLTREKDGNGRSELWVLGRRLRTVQENKKKIVEKKKEKAGKQRRRFFSRLGLSVRRGLLERETFGLISELGTKVWSKIRPRSFTLKGRVGFADPYYTGLLAAVLYVVSPENIDLDLDFSRPVGEFTLQIEGQVFLSVLMYYFLRFLLVYPLRSKVWSKLKWGKLTF